ncbi:hypothetical protein ACMYR3_10675 [Ampullimonas aquatilis]|uniref:hypothetical protein n=1 Tax=Ampullimonas aquatilis TaxID=1341549 RepID=UPI003C70FB79
MKYHLQFSALLLCILNSPMAVNAHALWIDRSGNGNGPARNLILRFGEAENALIETSPGKLDNIKPPLAWRWLRQDQSEAIHAEKTADGYLLGQLGNNQQITAEALEQDVMDLSKYHLGVVRPLFHARFVNWPITLVEEPVMALDILPVDQAGTTFKVYLNQAPLAKAKVTVIAPNLWTQEHHTDEQGLIHIHAPWRGTYVLEITHMENEAGEWQDQPFAAKRHRTTLSFVMAKGLPAKPMPPAQAH